MFGRLGTTLVVLLAVLVVGCGYVGGSKKEKLFKKQAKISMKEGRYGTALNLTEQLLKLDSNNLAAKRMRSKIKSKLVKEAETSFKSGSLKEAASSAGLVLKIDPKHKRARHVYRETKKTLLVQEAKQALEKDNVAEAVKKAGEAMKLDPGYAMAKEVIEEVNKARDEELAKLAAVVNAQMKAEDYRKALTAAEMMKELNPDDPEAEKRVEEINGLILAQSKHRNLSLAKLYFKEQRYESALNKAEEVLKVDPKNKEAIQLRERATAELDKPEVILTGIANFPGGLVATFEIPELNAETYIQLVGSSFEGFTVADINEENKTVELEYDKTGSKIVLAITR